MNEKTRNYLIGGLLVIFILLPRIGLLFNGLDSQRIWDTNTPAAFRLLYAVREGNVSNFYTQEQKYPLLGSYAYVPVIGGYYGVKYLLGQYKSPIDFIHAYALGETNLFFWLRLEMVVLNLLALWLLFYITKKFTPTPLKVWGFTNNSVRAGVYALALAAVNFYVTMFSVTPRIHSFAFLGGVLTLYTSLLLVHHKSMKYYLLAFGSAALTASASQSGFVAFIMPLIAHGYDGIFNRWELRLRKKELWIAIAVSLIVTILIGYPQLAALLLGKNWAGIKNVFLSSEHGGLNFSIFHFVRFVRHYFLSTELVSSWLILCGVWYVWCVKKRARIALDPYDYIALAHAGLFFVVFGGASLITGRFTLAILPSLFFIFARLLVKLDDRKIVLYPCIVLFLIQAYGVVHLTRIGFNGDTRTEAVEFLLTYADEKDTILSTLDSMLLGIAPSPESVEKDEIGDPGFTDTLIASRDLVGNKTRNIHVWNPSIREDRAIDLKEYTYVVLTADHPGKFRAEPLLAAHGFRLKQTIFANRRNNPALPSFIPWDIITPIPRLPVPLRLREFRAMGPTIFIYERT